MLSESHFREIVRGDSKGARAAAVRGTLRSLEVPYGWAVRWRNWRFDTGAARPARVNAPVISVGNLTVGGTGKTPLVAWLARWIRDCGVDVTIISRGYGGRRGGPNDEALELAARLPGVPHLLNPDRVAAARSALETNQQQVLILDDGFQHRRLARDLDIVLLDALEPFGYGHLLPRGLLREPIESLARAHVVALSRSDAVTMDRRREIEKRVQSIVPQATWLELEHRPTRFVSASGRTIQLAELAGRPVAAFCGIGNPAGFQHTLASTGLAVHAFLELPDHCSYDQSDTARLTNWLTAVTDVQDVVCTRKDLVKIPRDELAGKRLFALDIELRIVRGQEKLEERLRKLWERA
jgi:tetraacyldisaccharide 4'-kinase